MAAKYRVALFLEDRAHESFILPLCQRIIQEEGYDLNEVEAIRRLSEKHSPSPVIPAIPDPHVERWFMIDMNALRLASGLHLVGEAPPYKCDKDRYKKLLREVFRGTGVSPPLGGVEYGPLVVEKLDLYSACRLDTGLNRFVSDVRSWLRQLRTQQT